MQPRNLTMNLASKIKEARKTANLTQVEFAKKLGVSRSAVSMWELGNVNPKIDNLSEIIRVTNVDKNFFSDAIANTALEAVEDIEKTLSENNLNEFDDILKIINYKKTPSKVDLLDVTKFEDIEFTNEEKEKLLDYASLLISARK